MQSRRHGAAPFVLLLGGSLVLAACQGASGPTGGVGGETGSPAASPETSPAVSPEMSPETSPEMSPELSPATSPGLSPEVSPDTSPGTSPDASPGGDAMDLIPATIGDVEMTVTPVDAEEYANVNPGRRVVELAELAGVSLDDVTVASATGASDTASLFVDAVRIEGFDPTAVAGALQGVFETLPGTAVTSETVGGVDVLAVEQGDGSTTYVYASGDVIYFVQSGDPALAEEAVGALS